MTFVKVIAVTAATGPASRHNCQFFRAQILKPTAIPAPVSTPPTTRPIKKLTGVRMPHAKFPLPEGHVFAGCRKDNCHDGTRDRDAFWICYAQAALIHRWRFWRVAPTGHLDVATQSALVAIQQATGADPTGWLDEVTWDKVFTLDPRLVLVNGRES